ncbi:zinc ribbon domain-containing protein, partial [bacterium]|nr:zinc ribbon domain-containing protein [bacterium]
AAESTGEAGSGMGMGLGFMMPAIFADMMQGKGKNNDSASKASGGSANSSCPDCQHPVPDDSRFCPYCGHQILVISQCNGCGKNLPANARFCPKCGQDTSAKPEPRVCGNCQAENLPDSVFCNHCGEKIG